MKRLKIFLRVGFFPVIFNVFLMGVICNADTTIGINETFQEHNQWCWDASSKAVLDYYGGTVTQCEIANWVWGRSDCCGNTTFEWSHTCNSPNCLYTGTKCTYHVLSHWGVSSTHISNYLSKDEIVTEINGCRPFVIRFGWTSGGGHQLVGYGYDQNGDYVLYMDPWPGNGYTKKTYSQTISSSTHNWTNTLKVTTAHACTSCPSLWYSSNGEEFIRLSSIFIGATNREEEYRDYVLLKDLASVDGKYLFQIRETYPEDAFMDMVKLAIIDHSADIDLSNLITNKGTDYNHSPSLYFWLNNMSYLYGLEGLKIRVLSPLSAVHSSIGDVMSPLYSSDNQYVPMSQGDVISVTFKELPLMDEKRDFIFIGEGYYNRQEMIQE